MKENKIDEFDDYQEALELFKNVYLYDGHRKFVSEYAHSYVGRGENDIVRNDNYSKCVDYNDNGTSTWKIISPRNIFGVALEHSVNHKEHNKITSNLILNSGRYDLNRIMANFATIDVTDMSDEEIISLVESILSKNNEQLISEFGITENPNGILINAMILDTVLDYFKRQKQYIFPEILCNAETGNILVKENGNHILVTNNFVQYDNQILNYTMTRKFPNCKYEVDAIRGDNDLFGMISNKFTRLNNKGKEKALEIDILNLALANEKLRANRDSVHELYLEYLDISDSKEKRSRDE